MLTFRTFTALLLALASIAVAADIPVITSYGKTTDSFSISGIGLGASEAELLQELGDPLSKVEQPPQFGSVEIEYRYLMLTVHVTDGKVESLKLKKGPYQLDNGIQIGMTRTQVEQKLRQNFELEHISLQLGESDCYATLLFDRRVLVQVSQSCAG